MAHILELNDVEATLSAMEEMLRRCMDVMDSLTKAEPKIAFIREQALNLPLKVDEVTEKAGKLESCEATLRGAKETLLQTAAALERQIAYIDATMLEEVYGPPSWFGEFKG